MTQVINEPTKENPLLDHILANKDELVGNLKAGGSLGCSDHEMEKFRILQGGNKAKSRITTLGFRRTGFHRLKDLLGRIPWDMALGEEGSRRTDWFSRISSSKVHKGPAWCAGSQATLAGGLCGWTRKSWQNPNTEKVAAKRWKQG